MACVPAAASSPKTEACPAFAARSRWPSNSAFTRASQCGNCRRMLRPRPRRRRCDARGAQPPPSRWPRASKAPSTNAPPGCVRGAHRERSSLCSAIGRARFYSETVVNAREATARAHRGRRRRRFVTVSKARPNALAISAAGVAMRVYALRAAAHGAVEAYKIILTGQDWEAYEARADANVGKKVVAAQLDVFGK